MSHTKKLIVLTLVIAILLLGVMVPFAGAQVVVQDGLVNVAIGRITIEDVNVNVAAQVAAAICVQDVNVLAVDTGETQRIVCDIGASNRDLVITNN